MQQNNSGSLFNIWKESLSNRMFRISFLTTLVFLVIILISLSNYLVYNDTRAGAVLNDPFLKLFHAVNLTWLIFGMIYSGLFLGVFFLVKYPNYLLLTLQAYSIMAVIRMIVMYSIPLEPPAGMISLNDPFVQLFGTGITLKKDLFFSGHTSTMFLLFLTSMNKKMKLGFLIGTIIVGLSVLLQHTHYSVDVLAAPFFAYTSYRIAKIFNQKIGFIPLK